MMTGAAIPRHGTDRPDQIGTSCPLTPGTARAHTPDVAQTTNPMIGSTPKQPSPGPSWPSAVARVLLAPLALLTSVGAVKFGGFSAFSIVLLAGAAIYVATILFGGRSRSVRLAALGVLPLHFLFSVAKIAGGEGFAVSFLVLTGVTTVLLAMSLRSDPSPRY